MAVLSQRLRCFRGKLEAGRHDNQPNHSYTNFEAGIAVSIIERAANRLMETLAQTEKSAKAPVTGTADPAQDSLESRLNRKPAPPNRDALSKRQMGAGQAEPSPTIYGKIDLVRLAQTGMITPDGEKKQISEEFRVIKRPLLTNAFNRGAAAIRNGNLIMVTSSFPGEGKSFSAINLAMSIAMERDHTVLLVDADVANPSIPAFLGLKPSKGLMDLLLDEDLRFSDVLIKTNVEKLTILPAGRSDPHATELLASEGMNRLLDEMSQRYPDRIIIFDSPPLLVTTESRTLASKMGQIVMVVEAAKTPQEAVKEALSQIDKCEVVGLLLNKGSGLLGNDPYAYGTYGGYGS